MELKNRILFLSTGFLCVSFLVFLQSCGMCSHRGEESEIEPVDPVEHVQGRVPWSNLNSIGYPICPDSIPSVIFERYCYTTSYNTATRQPNWVMWQLKREHVLPRKEGVWNEYREDPDLPTEDIASNDDYATSGYDRGHMCPGSDCNWDDVGRDETFLLSNICPQNPNLNRGDWKEIEIACRNWAKKYGNLYIVCGPVFLKSQRHELIGKNMVPVPEAFFKVILCLGSSTAKGIGFVCRNTDGNRKKDFYVNSIHEVERITGYSFFPNLDSHIKDQVSNMRDISAW